MHNAALLFHFDIHDCIGEILDFYEEVLTDSLLHGIIHLWVEGREHIKRVDETRSVVYDWD